MHTLGLPTTEVLGTTFRGADLETQLAVTARRMAAALPAGTLIAARESVTAATVNILHSYRRHCATASNPGQLILPEALKLLPLYALALEKSPCLRCDPSICRSYVQHICAMTMLVERRIGSQLVQRLWVVMIMPFDTVSRERTTQLNACRATQLAVCIRVETQHDARATALFRLESLPIRATVPLLHARLIALHRSMMDATAGLC